MQTKPPPLEKGSWIASIISAIFGIISTILSIVFFSVTTVFGFFLFTGLLIITIGIIPWRLLFHSLIGRKKMLAKGIRITQIIFVCMGVVSLIISILLLTVGQYSVSLLPSIKSKTLAPTSTSTNVPTGIVTRIPLKSGTFKYSWGSSVTGDATAIASSSSNEVIFSFGFNFELEAFASDETSADVMFNDCEAKLNNTSINCIISASKVWQPSKNYIDILDHPLPLEQVSMRTYEEIHLFESYVVLTPSEHLAKFYLSFLDTTLDTLSITWMYQPNDQMDFYP